MIVLFGRDSSIVKFTVDDGATAAVALIAAVVAVAVGVAVGVAAEVAVDFTDFAALVEDSATGGLIFYVEVK